MSSSIVLVSILCPFKIDTKSAHENFAAVGAIVGAAVVGAIDGAFDGAPVVGAPVGTAVVGVLVVGVLVGVRVHTQHLSSVSPTSEPEPEPEPEPGSADRRLPPRRVSPIHSNMAHKLVSWLSASRMALVHVVDSWHLLVVAFHSYEMQVASEAHRAPHCARVFALVHGDCE
jgi:hypothetical protein